MAISKKRYWCSDDFFRGCILRNLFGTTFKVLLPLLPPNAKTGKLPKRGTMYPLSKIFSLALSLRCTDIEGMFAEHRFLRKSLGDIDFAVEISKDVVLVAEVKTRLIPYTLSKYRRNGLDVLKLMLKYHLDEPREATSAWKELIQKGIVKLSSNRTKGYDNPASIAELVKSVLGFTYRYGSRYKSIIISAIMLCAVKPILHDVIMFVENTYRYLRDNCGIDAVGYCLLIVSPEEINEDLAKVSLACYGNACYYLDPVLSRTYEMSYLLADCPHCLSCSACKYRTICAEYCYSTKTH